MNNLLPGIGTSADFGLDWPTWIAMAGFGLFCLLGFYATLLLVFGKHLPRRLQFLQLPSLRGRMLVAFVLATTLPVISLALVLSERSTGERLATTSTILQSQAETVGELADFFLQRYLQEISNAANLVRPSLASDGSEVAATIVDPLIRVHQDMRGIRVILVADRQGRVIATTRQTGDSIEAATENVPASADKEYINRPLETREAYISDGLRIPGGDGTLVTAISVPVLDDSGAPVGAIVAFYDLSGLASAQRLMHESDGIGTIIIDRVGQVMFASDGSGFSKSDRLDKTSVFVDPNTASGPVFSFSLPSDAAQYLAARHTLSSGWQLVMFRPLQQIEAALLEEYGVALTWLAGALLVSICLALVLVHSLSGPLKSLDASVRNFDLNMNQEVPRPPADAPREVLTIFEHLGSLDERLRATYRKLRKSVQQGEKLRGELIYVIANREKEIAQRTEELKEANATLERLSREDSLTGLANRRWFAEFLARAWQGALRDKTPICILIIDIDNFKAYNDNYGHQKGDHCLKLVAQAIRRAVGRASDLVSRYGGEEFIVVLGDTPLEGGLKIAENIRATVEGLGIPHKGAKEHRCVTVSIGVTSTLPTHDTQPETVLVAADRAMYNAKNDGRNKVAYSTSARTGTYQALCVSDHSNTQLS
ncbi:MAG: diguanylate cyclase [Gammaproteobacteria bacterium]